MTQIPSTVIDTLADPIYFRHDFEMVNSTLNDLGIKNDEFIAFERRYEGPFWSERIGVELLDLYQGDRSIRSVTEICRDQFGFPDKFVVLTELSSGQVIILDSFSGNVYEVDFEGGEKKLINGDLRPRWESFYQFLIDYFS